MLGGPKRSLRLILGGLFLLAGSVLAFRCELFPKSKTMIEK